MVKAIYEVSDVVRLIPVHAPRPTLPLASYRAILEGNWSRDYSEEHDTEQEYDNLAPEILIDMLLRELMIDSEQVVQPAQKQSESTGLGLAFWGNSESESKACLKLPEKPTTGRAGHHGHNANSSLSSLSSLSSFDTNSLPPQDPLVKQTPPTSAILPSQLPDVAPAYGKLEQPPLPSLSRITKWSRRVRHGGGRYRAHGQVVP
ncbi:hypothetical protein B0H21DRAFT_143524 [Amylocystis lapponica]|nr:hypothetical protein B0H21DRAFT_143524 [Amylocystis lapponica]